MTAFDTVRYHGYLMRRLLLASAISCTFLAGLLGCNGISAADATSLRSAQEQSFQIYEIPVDGGSPARGLARGSFCSVDSVLVHYSATSFDAGGAIVCGKPKP